MSQLHKTLALCALIALAGCGKAGAPRIAGSSFPHHYPDPSLSAAPAADAAPEDQAALTNPGDKALFTEQGSYIDPAVRATELSRGGALPGAGLPYSRTYSGDSKSTPLSSGLTGQTQSPLQTPAAASGSQPEQP